jgi:hypothetical protein
MATAAVISACTCNAYKDYVPFTCYNCRRQFTKPLSESERRDQCPSHSTITTKPGRSGYDLCPACISAGYSVQLPSLQTREKLFFQGLPAAPQKICTCNARHLRRKFCFRCPHEWNVPEEDPESTMNCNKCEIQVCDYFGDGPHLCKYCLAAGYRLQHGAGMFAPTQILDARGAVCPTLWSIDLPPELK